MSTAMALRIRFQYPVGSKLGYSIERLSDGLFYDFSNAAFVASPAQLIASLPESTGPFIGRYMVTLAPTPVATFADGDYVVTVHDLANSSTVVAELAATMHAGDDATESLNGPTIPTVGDPGFEAPVVGNDFSYNPTGSPWTFSGVPGNGSGVTGNNSGFTSGNSAAPEGTQVGYVQGKGTITQPVAGWSAGSYTISFNAAQRGNDGVSAQDFEVLVDGGVVGTFKPAGVSYQAYTTAAFAVTAGSHTIAFLGLNTAGGDNTAFIDNVIIAFA
jgi:hypothetical protein